MFNKGQFAGLMKKAQEMQKQLESAQEELAQSEVVGESGAGLVKIVMTCKHKVKKVTIDPSIVDDSDVEMLEDLVAAAINDVAKKVDEYTADKMTGIAGGIGGLDGLNLPGM